MVPLAWWCPLLMVLQTLGPFRTGVYTEIMWQIMWHLHRLHTGGLYLTNYVTSEGNWLHQVLFRGFIAKGVNTYAPPLFHIFLYFETSYLFHFTSPIWNIFLMSITWNPNKNQFEITGVMQHNRKNAKGGEHFCKAHNHGTTWWNPTFATRILLMYSTSHKFGQTYLFKDFSLFALFFTLLNNNEDIKWHPWNSRCVQTFDWYCTYFPLENILLWVVEENYGR
jgi:hypothetical protein